MALDTMHAAKVLEWPIVAPINTMTGIMAPECAVTDRVSNSFFCPVFWGESRWLWCYAGRREGRTRPGAEVRPPRAQSNSIAHTQYFLPDL